MDRKQAVNLFVERSLRSALDFFKEAVFSEEIARSRGLLQTINTRLKLPLLIVCLAFSIFANTASFLAGLYIVSVILAVSSGVKFIYFLKRVWFFIPIFTLFIAIPAVFIQGAYAALVFVLRVATCVSFVVVFTITTRHSQFLRSARSLGVPAVFTEVLDMTYRYIFLFLKIFEEMHLSLKSRLVETLHAGGSRHWIASRIAFLFKRSIRMSEEVYLAMLARGYGIGEK